jgi:hypothetical protein
MAIVFFGGYLLISHATTNDLTIWQEFYLRTRKTRLHYTTLRRRGRAYGFQEVTFKEKTMRSHWCRAIGLVLAFAAAANAEQREWRDLSGKYSRVAEYVGQRDGRVQLKQSDGKNISIAVEKLSAKDREFIAQQGASETAALIVAGAVQKLPAMMKIAPKESGPSSSLFKFAAAHKQPPAGGGEQMGAGPPLEAGIPPMGQPMGAGPGMAAAPAQGNSYSAPPWKYVYYGCRSTSHIFDWGYKQYGFGTINYCYHGQWQLAYLYKTYENEWYRYYGSIYANPNLTWVFCKYPYCCKHCIYINHGPGWNPVLFDEADLVHPR